MDDYAFEHYHYDYESGMEKLKKEFGPINRHGVSAWLENMGHPNLAKMIMDEKRFPSTQPEIVRCCDCKYFDSECHYCDYFQWNITCDNFCSKAERRTDG